MNEQLYNRAAQLLYLVWVRIPMDYKQKYARNIWDQFQSRIRVAAFTSDLSKAFNSLCSTFNARAAYTYDARQVIAELSSPDAREILRLWREEPSTLVVMVQQINEENKTDG